MADLQSFELQIHGESLPGATVAGRTHVRLGIQNGVNGEDVEQDVPGDAETARFTAEIRVKRNAKDGRPMFSGPYVFGRSKEQFLYLSWGERGEGGRWEMFARIKIPLYSLGWDQIMKAVDTGQPLEVTVNLMNSNGKPVSGSLKDHQMRWMR